MELFLDRFKTYLVKLNERYFEGWGLDLNNVPKFSYLGNIHTKEGGKSEVMVLMNFDPLKLCESIERLRECFMFQSTIRLLSTCILRSKCR